jgi:hypothetical protein
MNLHWLLRMRLWARNPPSPRRVKAVLVVLAICLVVFALERLDLWPDWATADRMRSLPIRP